jgi:hypothetical protein
METGTRNPKLEIRKIPSPPTPLPQKGEGRVSRIHATPDHPIEGVGNEKKNPKMTNEANMLLKTKSRVYKRSQTNPFTRGVFVAAIPARGIALFGVRRVAAALLRSFRQGGQRPP